LDELNPEILYDTILRMVNDPHELEALRNASRELANSFAWESIAKKFVNLLERPH
jgi:glycosyltransferase involved in cell wall biosynthesis